MSRKAERSYSSVSRIPVVGRPQFESTLFSAATPIRIPLSALQREMQQQRTPEASHQLFTEGTFNFSYRDFTVENPNPGAVWNILASGIPALGRFMRRETLRFPDIPALQAKVTITDDTGTFSRTHAFSPPGLSRFLVATAMDRNGLATFLVNEEVKNRYVKATDIRPLSHENGETRERVQKLAQSTAEVNQYDVISLAIHNLQERNSTIERITETINFGGKNFEVSAGIPMTTVSALDVALALGVITQEDYTKTKMDLENRKGTKKTRVIIQGHARELRAGPMDEDIDGVMMKGVAEIARVVEKVRAGQSVDIPETEVHVISPIPAAGIAPGTNTVKELHNLNPYGTNGGWLDAQTQVLAQWMVRKGILAEKDQPGRSYEIEGTSRGAYMAWRLSNMLPNVTKTVYLNKPAGFHRLGYPLGVMSALSSGSESVDHAKRHATMQPRMLSRMLGGNYIYFGSHQQVNNETRTIEESELLRMTVQYTEPPKSTVVVTIPEQDTIVYPFVEVRGVFNQRNRHLSEEDIRQETITEFTNGNSNTTIVRVQGNHVVPRVRDNQIQERLGYVREIAQQTNRGLFDPHLRNKTVIEIQLADSEETLFRVTSTYSEPRQGYRYPFSN